MALRANTPADMTNATPSTVNPQLHALTTDILEQVGLRVVGQHAMVERLLIALLTGGHVLLEGVPGLAKTLTVRTLAETVRTTFSRIQFTPDLLPADVIGTQVFDQATATFSVKRGPIFANIVLADEINRAPAKTQSALLEAMQERQVTIEGDRFELPLPFMVLATQNPIDLEGTYPLPEAQIDRFLVRLFIGYPTAADEKGILRRFTDGSPRPRKVLEPEQILTMQHLVDRVHVEDAILDYVVRLATFTREHARLFLGEAPR
ncbi:MAG TPA: AAA family ATPase, partial [Gemmatimonadaceae bacterium]|nr:AAA family ATPase [Gemmatimonadaceae bacterium]